MTDLQTELLENALKALQAGDEGGEEGAEEGEEEGEEGELGDEGGLLDGAIGSLDLNNEDIGENNEAKASVGGGGGSGGAGGIDLTTSQPDSN